MICGKPEFARGRLRSGQSREYEDETWPELRRRWRAIPNGSDRGGIGGRSHGRPDDSGFRARRGATRVLGSHELGPESHGFGKSWNHREERTQYSGSGHGGIPNYGGDRQLSQGQRAPRTWADRGGAPGVERSGQRTTTHGPVSESGWNGGRTGQAGWGRGRARGAPAHDRNARTLPAMYSRTARPFGESGHETEQGQPVRGPRVAEHVRAHGVPEVGGESAIGGKKVVEPVPETSEQEVTRGPDPTWENSFATEHESENMEGPMDVEEGGYSDYSDDFPEQ